MTKTFPTNDGFIILTCDDGEMDKIFDENTDLGFTPLTPPELIGNRSVLIFRVDPYIFQNIEDDIKEEIIAKRDWIQEISHIYKFRNNNTIKITFSNAKTDQKPKNLA